jgi:sulfofructose kinase
VKAWDAIGVGLVVRDLSVLLDHFPHPDEKIRAREIHESGGGPVPTALVTLARLGRKTAISSLVGEDDVGRFILDGLDRENVDTSAVDVVPGFVSPTSVILVENGRRTILEAPHEVDLPLTRESVRKLPLDDAAAVLVDARAVEAQLEAARRVRDAGGLVVLDCGHPREGVDELIANSDVAILSHTYPAALHGDGHELDLDLEGFLRDLRERLPSSGPRVAGMTLGASGCAFLDGDGRFFRLVAHPVDAVDTTGAGDVFHGAFVHAYLKTASIPESARFANAAAAVKCKAMTGRAPLASEEELWRSSSR